MRATAAPLPAIEPGQTVEVEVIRDGERKTIEVTLEPRPDRIN